MLDKAIFFRKGILDIFLRQSDILWKCPACLAIQQANIARLVPDWVWLLREPFNPRFRRGQHLSQQRAPSSSSSAWVAGLHAKVERACPFLPPLFIFPGLHSTQAAVQSLPQPVARCARPNWYFQLVLLRWQFCWTPCHAFKKTVFPESGTCGRMRGAQSWFAGTSLLWKFPLLSCISYEHP